MLGCERARVMDIVSCNAWTYLPSVHALNLKKECHDTSANLAGCRAGVRSSVVISHCTPAPCPTAGTGKTTAARVLSRRAALPLVYVPLEALVSKWYGESEKQVAQVCLCSILGEARVASFYALCFLSQP